MRLPITVGRFKRTIATAYDELSVAEFNKLNDWAKAGGNDIVELYSIVTDIPKNTIANLKTSQAKLILDKNIAYLKFKWDTSKIKTPNVVALGALVGLVPDDIDELPFGQFVAIDQYLSELSEREDQSRVDIDRMCAVVLVFLWSSLYPDERFDVKKMKARFSIVESANYKDCYGVELFFWKKFYALRKREKGGLRNYLMLILLLLKSNVSRALVSLRRLMHLQAET